MTIIQGLTRHDAAFYTVGDTVDVFWYGLDGYVVRTVRNATVERVNPNTNRVSVSHHRFQRTIVRDPSKGTLAKVSPWR